ncbi:hypothetical protein ABIC03_006990 [Bradyrhizobium sp. RT6a]|jgi:hypothetical protein
MIFAQTALTVCYGICKAGMVGTIERVQCRRIGAVAVRESKGDAAGGSGAGDAPAS